VEGSGIHGWDQGKDPGFIRGIRDSWVGSGEGSGIYEQDHGGGHVRDPGLKGGCLIGRPGSGKELRAHSEEGSRTEGKNELREVWDPEWKGRIICIPEKGRIRGGIQNSRLSSRENFLIHEFISCPL